MQFNGNVSERIHRVPIYDQTMDSVVNKNSDTGPNFRASMASMPEFDDPLEQGMQPHIDPENPLGLPLPANENGIDSILDELFPGEDFTLQLSSRARGQHTGSLDANPATVSASQSVAASPDHHREIGTSGQPTQPNPTVPINPLARQPELPRAQMQSVSTDRGDSGEKKDGDDNGDEQDGKPRRPWGRYAMIAGGLVVAVAAFLVNTGDYEYKQNPPSISEQAATNLGSVVANTVPTQALPIPGQR